MTETAPVMIMAGGTGGHVFPALAIADELRRRQIPVIWLGTRRGLEATLVPKAGFPIDWIEVSGLRGHGLQRLLTAPLMLIRAVWQAKRVLRRHRPQLVLGMGGFASGPGGLSARGLGIPLVVHEQNAVAGMTNRWLARIANRVLAAFPGSFSNRSDAVVVGNPVRREIATLAAPEQRFADRHGPQRLLVLGGSQGALALNQLLPEALALMPADRRPQVRHQAGGKLLDTAESAYRAADIDVELTPFIDDMAEAYGWADLVLCRSGALTVAELAAAGVGAVLVPYPHAVDDHQTVNGRYLADHGAAVILSQQELTAERLAEQLQTLLNDRRKLLDMAIAARQRARIDATDRITELCLELTRESGR